MLLVLVAVELFGLVLKFEVAPSVVMLTTLVDLVTPSVVLFENDPVVCSDGLEVIVSVLDLLGDVL